MSFFPPFLSLVDVCVFWRGCYRLFGRWSADVLLFDRSFNVGSPINVPAGHYANMDKLVAHYKEKQFKEEEEKRALMKEGKLPGQKPYKGP